MRRDLLAGLLEKHGIQPTAQRLAVAEYVLQTDIHPSADQVWAAVDERAPLLLSRATVYNTLHLFVDRGLIRQLVLAEGRVVFDPKVGRHHHFIDEQTGTIHDIPWEALEVKDVSALSGYKVREYEVVMRGHRTARRRSRSR
jgi:Fe2+ or Zn2+ uptake regulation protein